MESASGLRIASYFKLYGLLAKINFRSLLKCLALRERQFQFGLLFRNNNVLFPFWSIFFLEEKLYITKNYRMDYPSKT
jgi:hypothetical protein